MKQELNEEHLIGGFESKVFLQWRRVCSVPLLKPSIGGCHDTSGVFGFTASTPLRAGKEWQTITITVA